MTEQISKEQIDEAFELAKDFESEYWNSELPNYMNLIEDLRLSNNIHETAHSRVLYKLLCCGKCHSYPFLQAFLEIIGIEKDSNDVKLFVEKENIDLLIEIGDKVIILENKVNHAKDQDRQIATYYDKVKSGKIEELKNYQKSNDTYTDIYVIYLTRKILDNDPNENSLPVVVKNELGDNYKKISYEKEIREWICEYKEQYKEKYENELINSALIQYGDFIENMFEPNKKRIEIMNEIIEELLNEKCEVENTKKGDMIESKFEKINDAKKILTEYEKGLEQYLLDYVANELKNYVKTELPKEIKCEINYPKAHIDFCVLYKDELYRGVVSLYRYEKFWFGLCMKDGCLVDWDEKLNNKTSIDELEEAFSNKPYIKTDNEKEYAYWKYCNDGIEKMIEGIKEYIDVIRNLK